MNKSDRQTKEVVNLKFRVMINRIDKLCDMFEILGKEMEHCELRSIGRGYFESYNEIIQTGDYDKYSELENEVIRKVAPIELSLEEYIRKTKAQHDEIIDGIIDKIKNSENYQNFTNLDIPLKQIKVLKQLIKLYAPYIVNEGIQENIRKASKLKFEILLRRQVSRKVYGGEENEGSLVQYDDETEMKYFIELTREKVTSLGLLLGEAEELEGAFLEKILLKEELLNELIERDMSRHPKEYMSLLQAKIFNPYLCNIKDKSYERINFALSCYIQEQP